MPAKSRTIGCIQLWEASMRLMGLGLVSMITLVVALFAGAQDRGARGGQRGGAGTPAMTMTIAGFPDGGQFPVKFSQAAEGVAPGEGRSPAISWANVPAGTQGFVLHMHDMDLARNRTADDQVHWVVWNIPAAATGLAEGAPKGSRLPDGSYQISATGDMYRGPGAAANGPCLEAQMASSSRSSSSSPGWTAATPQS